MKRYQNPWLWSSFVAFCFQRCLSFQNGTRAESTVSLERKLSKDILKKVAEGRGGDFVRVIVQPANSADLSIDSTLVYSGGENIRKFKNFARARCHFARIGRRGPRGPQRCFLRLAES